MSFDCSTCTIPKVIPQVDVPVRLMTCIDAQSESSNDTARESSEILYQESKIMEVWTKAFEDRDREDAANVYNEINTVDEESEKDRERARATEHLP